jgi:hypothetical protein
MWSMAQQPASRPRPRGRPRSSSHPPEGFTDENQAIIRLQLDLPAKQALDDLCQRRGMTQIAALSRTVRWLVAQDEVVQAWVLNLMSREHLAHVSQILLKRYSGHEGG